MSQGMLVWRNNDAGGRLMDKYSLFAAQFLTHSECFSKKGHKACAGCGVALALRHVYKALGESAEEINKAKWQVPWEQTSIFKPSQKDNNAVKPSLLSIPKQEGSLNICFDNEAIESKLSTGILIKKTPDIAAAGNFPYAATACPSHPFDLIEKVRKAWSIKGNAFIHILCPCPPEWGFESQDCVRIGRMAVETRLFPLYEISNGYYKITVNEPNTRPLAHYIKKQSRFSGLKKKAIEELNMELTGNFKKLKEKESTGI